MTEHAVSLLKCGKYDIILLNSYPLYSGRKVLTSMAIRKEKPVNKVSDGTIIDYVAWRGDLTFEQSSWGEIDSVIAAVFAYANLGENELAFGSGRTLRLGDLADSDLLTRLPQEGIGNSVKLRKELLVSMALSRRFQDITVLDQVNDVDPARNIQFSAMTLDVPGVGTVIAYRGTDPSPVGWKEDFMMSYATPVPAQTAALRYLEKAASNTAGPLYLAGHSKGGNLALYAAAHADPDIQARFKTLYSYDGPGLDDETIASEGYRRIEPLIRSDVPSGSIVGMLMNYVPKYRVVQSDARSIFQHDPFTWKLVGRRFLEAESVSTSSQILDRTIHEWLKSCTPEQREIFVTSVFSLLDKTEPANADDLLKKADDDAKMMILSLISKLIAIHAGVSWEKNVLQPLIQASDDLRQKLKAIQGNLIKSNVIQIDNHGNGFQAAAAETMSMAETGGLSHKEGLRLMLFTEEMLSMVSIVTGEMKATFWIERLNREFELHMTTNTVINRNARRQLKVAPNDKPEGFLAKLRNIFERARAADSDQVCFALPSGPDRQASGEWDGYERSILYRLADDVRIAIHGNEVHMTVRKEF